MGAAQEGKTMSSVLSVLFLLITVLTMVTTMHRLTAKEKNANGHLKGARVQRQKDSSKLYSLRFYDRRDRLRLRRRHRLRAGMVRYESKWRDGHLPRYAASVKKMLRGTAADTLRPYTPKKMSYLLIERTKFFHKLSFGTRWNLRDIMRHKSRTAMSLLGIVAV